MNCFYCIFALGPYIKAMKRRFALIALLLMSITTSAQQRTDSTRMILPDTIVITSNLRARMDSLSFPFSSEPDVTFDDISDWLSRRLRRL